MGWANPERAWERPAPVTSVDREEIERRVGRTQEPVEVLSGGLANLNVRVGDRVLRIYRRDPAVARVEEALLRREWISFRVPRIFESGDDFLLQEYVPHRPLQGTAEEGAAVGRALAEIHSVKFDVAGLLGPSLTVVHPFPDLVSTLIDYVGAQAIPPELRDRIRGFLEARSAGLRSKAGSPTLLHADWKASNLHGCDRGLLVLDWEFAYSGAALSDIGQLLRWPPPEPFVDAFANSYGDLPESWRGWAEAFDLVNLAGIFARSTDVRRRIETTLHSPVADGP